MRKRIYISFSKINIFVILIIGTMKLEFKRIFYNMIRGVSKGVVSSIICLAFLALVFLSVINIDKDNFEPIYFFIGTAITLSGFTMLSGIFSKDKKTKIEKDLFVLSIMFLISAFMFILFIGFYIITKDIKDPIFREQILIYLSTFIYYIGIIPFLFGFAFLIIVLIKHYQQIE